MLDLDLDGRSTRIKMTDTEFRLSHCVYLELCINSELGLPRPRQKKNWVSALSIYKTKRDLVIWEGERFVTQVKACCWSTENNFDGQIYAALTLDMENMEIMLHKGIQKLHSFSYTFDISFHFMWLHYTMKIKCNHI